MDLYVRQFSNTELLHGQFYTEEIIIDAFKNYSTQVISRYVNSPSVLGWEIANDPRCVCSSTLGPASYFVPDAILPFQPAPYAPQRPSPGGYPLSLSTSNQWIPIIWFLLGEFR